MFVLPEFQGKGVATAAARLLINQVAKQLRRYLFAYPSVENELPNAFCRKLCFTLIEETESEYSPKNGLLLRCNVWRIDLGIA